MDDQITVESFLKSEIFQRIISFIHNKENDSFESLALEGFAFQYRHNDPYRQYCNRLKATPDTVDTWEEIPFVPTAIFKQKTLSCLPSSQYFLTSGTTRGIIQRGRHALPVPELYHQALRQSFKSMVVPDCDRISMIMLAQNPVEFPHSSLSYMLNDVHQTYGKNHTFWMLGKTELYITPILKALENACAENEPILILGIVSALEYLLSYCIEHRIQFKLPFGSRIMDTGGWKASFGKWNEQDMSRYYSELFAIDASHQVHEFGMTEMLSQYYTDELSSHYAHRAMRGGYQTPHWVRTRVLQPATLKESPKGEPGLLCHFDLANVGTIFHILSEDIGIQTPNGFIFRKRLLGAEARGCSLQFEPYF